MGETNSINREKIMGTRPIFPLLMNMAYPPIISMFIQSMYSIVDSVFVARLGKDALTAVTLAFPIQNLILALAVGTGVGINSFISRKLGEKNYEKADSAAVHGVLLTLLHWVIFTILAIVLIKPFFRMFTDNKEIFDMCLEYSYVVTIFSIGVLMQICLEKIFQSTGRMVYPMLIQIVGAIINIILDPIMIFGYFGFPALGVLGAAIATVIGQMIAMIFGIILFIKKSPVKIKFNGFKFNIGVVKNIYSVGIPSALMLALGSVLITGLNSILSGLSAFGVAIYGAYFRLQTFIFMPVSGLSQGFRPIAGYNYGAKDRQRTLGVLKTCFAVGAGIMLFGTALFNIFPDKLLMLFNAEGEMISFGVPALRIISIGYIGSAVGIVFSAFFEAIGKGLHSLVVSLLRQLLLTLPLAYILSKHIGITGVWISFPISEGIASIVSLMIFIYVCKSDKVLKMD